MSTNTFIFVVIMCLSTSMAQNQEAKEVTLTQGRVRGYKAFQTEVFEFLGIPYATTPKGIDRYKAPLPAPTWTETFEAVNGLISCPQNTGTSSVLSMDITENCLVANVYIPDTEETNLPVFVYIHGGAYLLGHGHDLIPRTLVETKKIVAVTFNYRLGAHGFLCLGTEFAPGNAGLKDSLALLRWVKNNIANFGGNPDDVTLGGYSAGASAADILMLSKAAEGLFNKVIPESGSALSSWSFQIDPVKTAWDFAEKLSNSNIKDFNELQQFYETVSYEELFSDVSVMFNYNNDLGFTPCIEKDLGKEIIMEDTPFNIIKRNEYRKIPVLYGFANMEGLFRLPNFVTWAKEMNENFARFLPQDLQFKNDKEKDAVAQSVKEFYFRNKSVGISNLFNYIDFCSDSMFDYAILRATQLYAESGHNAVYLYVYSFYGRHSSVLGLPNELVNFPGARHCAQSEAVMDGIGATAMYRPLTEEFIQVREKVRELWLNFILTGNPVPEGSSFPVWPPAQANRSPHMILDREIKLGGVLNKERTQFWDGIYELYYRQPVLFT